MLFNSFEFAIFFPVVTISFYCLPHRFRWSLLLAASCFFYMFFKPIYILILFFTIIIDYFAGILIEKNQNPVRKRLLLLLSICANVGILAFFKYYNFLVENINTVLEYLPTHKSLSLINILLPIGLSFHTFQAMSYTIEVYRGRQKAERHFGIYALYVMFYPQLVAGPIERPQNVLHQFHEVKRFNYNNLRSGLILMSWGFFKKCVIADRLALFVNEAYGNIPAYEGISLIVATVFFSFQIFCDFSGYSDIALGTARCMGYNLMLNFNKPYLSTGINEFWRRWHISLSTWFRDYVYIPLGGNRVRASRRYFNLFIVFMLSGVWHGANWTFLVWGILHGIFLVSELVLKKWIHLPANILNLNFSKFFFRALVFFLVTFSWIFFRAPTLKDAFTVIKKIPADYSSQIANILSNFHNARGHILYVNQTSADFVLAIATIIVLIGFHNLQKEQNFDEWLLKKSKRSRWAIYYLMVVSFVLLGVFKKTEFIYFQF